MGEESLDNYTASAIKSVAAIIGSPQLAATNPTELLKPSTSLQNDAKRASSHVTLFLGTDLTVSNAQFLQNEIRSVS